MTLGTSARARLATTRAPLPAASPQSSSGWSAPPPGCGQHISEQNIQRQASPLIDSNITNLRVEDFNFLLQVADLVLRSLKLNRGASQARHLVAKMMSQFRPGWSILWEPAFEAPHSPPPTRNSRSAIASLGNDILSPEKSKSKKGKHFERRSGFTWSPQPWSFWAPALAGRTSWQPRRPRSQLGSEKIDVFVDVFDIDDPINSWIP